MNAGKVEQIGSPLDLYDNPANLFVAGFIGSPAMNFLPEKRNGRDVLLGVRPEHLEPCAPGDAGMTVDIDLIEPLGSDTLVYGHIGAERTGARVAVRLHQSVDARTGHLPVRYAPAHVHYFDPASGKRIEA